MARRQGPSGGLMALRAALGAVAGGLEGYSKSQELERRRKLDEQAAQLAQFNALRAAEFRMAPVRTQADPAAAGVTALDTPKPAPSFDTTQQSALGKALSAGMGVGTTPASPLTSPVTLALDTGKMRQFELGAGMQAANPADRITVGGMELGVRAPETPEEKMQKQVDLYRQQKGVDADFARQKATADSTAEEAAFKRRVSRYIEGGLTPARAVLAAETDAKLGDLVITPSAALSAETARRGQDIGAATARRGQDMTDSRIKEKSDANEMISGLQAMGVARASSALNLLNTNNETMKAFEQKVLKKEAQVTASQLEAARKAMKGDEGAAFAEKALAEGIPFLMEPNPELLRYIRAAKGISGAVREITPRGGSNLMMQMEQALAGIGPAGTDQQSIDQVQSFRNDMLTGVQEGVRALRGARSVDGGAPAPSVGGMTYTPGMSFEEWKRKKTGGK